jgi:acetyl esterase/lipase
VPDVALAPGGAPGGMTTDTRRFSKPMVRGMLARSSSRRFLPGRRRRAEGADPGVVPPVRVRTGGLDTWEKGAQELVALLRERGIAVDAALIPGAKHDWPDWRGRARRPRVPHEVKTR